MMIKFFNKIITTCSLSCFGQYHLLNEYCKCIFFFFFFTAKILIYNQIMLVGVQKLFKFHKVLLVSIVSKNSVTKKTEATWLHLCFLFHFLSPSFSFSCSFSSPNPAVEYKPQHRKCEAKSLRITLKCQRAFGNISARQDRVRSRYSDLSCHYWWVWSIRHGEAS